MTEATAFAASSLEAQGGLLGGVMARGVDWRAGGVDVMSGCVDTHHTTARARGRGRVSFMPLPRYSSPPTCGC